MNFGGTSELRNRFGDAGDSPFRASSYMPPNIEEIERLRGGRNTTTEFMEIEDKGPSQLKKYTKLLYDFQEQVNAIDHTANFGFRSLFRFNYLIRNGLFLNEELMNTICREKEKRKHEALTSIKSLAIQDCSGTIATVDNQSHITFRRTNLRDIMFKVDQFTDIATIAFHPFKNWMFAFSSLTEGTYVYYHASAERIVSNDNYGMSSAPGHLNDFTLLLKTKDVATHIEFSPNGRLMALVNKHSCVLKIWDLDNDEIQTLISYGSTLVKAKWSPDGAYLAVSSKESHNFIIYETGTWTKTKYRFEKAITSMEWDATGNTCYLYSKDSRKIKILKDMQAERATTIYGRKPLDIQVYSTYNLEKKIPEGHILHKLVFCIAPRCKKIFFCTIKGPKQFYFIADLEDNESWFGEDRAINSEDIDDGILRKLFFCPRYKFFDSNSTIIKIYQSDRIEEVNFNPSRNGGGYM
jgi:hypothetical protein